MNTFEAAKFTGIPEDLLIKMRDRPTSTLRSGPPYSKKVDKQGLVSYIYSKQDLKRWMKLGAVRITAAEASRLLGVDRKEIINIHQFVRIQIGPNKGSVLIYPAKNIFLFLPPNRPTKGVLREA